MKLLTTAVLSTLALAALVVACAGPAAAPDAREPATDDGAKAFLARVDQDIRGLYQEYTAAHWIGETYITDDTQLLQSKADERWLTAQNRLVAQSAPFRGL